MASFVSASTSARVGNRSAFVASAETRYPYERRWFFSRRADFWLATGGASVGLLVSSLVIFWHGDRELDALDFVLSEFHLGATYDAVTRRRLWRRSQVDVLLIPLIILALTYVLSLAGHSVLITSIAMYAAVWHRGRQSLGVARFYQRGMGGPVSRTHQILFRGAIYLPMLAAALAYTHLSPRQYDGEPYLALNVGAEITSMVGLVAALWVIVYVAWALRQGRTLWRGTASERASSLVHPGEWWVVLGHAVAFGSGYALGASNASFLLVLAVHHEVQYLYFAYAMARHTKSFHPSSKVHIDAAMADNRAHTASIAAPGLRAEAKFAASFLLWPVIGFAGALVGGWLKLEWLVPLGVGGLFCHYWLDSRIWTRRSFQS